MQSILQRRLFFIFHGTVLLQDTQIVCAECIGNFSWKDFVVRMADYLFGREMKQLLEAAIGEQIPAVDIFDINDRRCVVGHVSEQLLATMQRLLREFSIRHARREPDIRVNWPVSSQIAWPRARNQRYSPALVRIRYSTS